MLRDWEPRRLSTPEFRRPQPTVGLELDILRRAQRIGITGIDTFIHPIEELSEAVFRKPPSTSFPEVWTNRETMHLAHVIGADFCAFVEQEFGERVVFEGARRFLKLDLVTPKGLVGEINVGGYSGIELRSTNFADGTNQGSPRPNLIDRYIVRFGGEATPRGFGFRIYDRVTTGSKR
jgi:hypothetical protein